KDNWVWFMELLISDLGLPSGQGLTIISDQHKGIIEAAKQESVLASSKGNLSGIPCVHGHNQRSCPTKTEGTTSVEAVTGTGEDVTASVGNVCASGGMVTARGGSVTARGAATQSEIAISQSPPVESQEQEAPMQEQPVQEQPLQEQPVQRKSERIAQILFNKPPTPGPGLD
ncbi:hypothetical protein Tco_0070405, partial [Tanacetum coccineum]